MNANVMKLGLLYFALRSVMCVRVWCIFDVYAYVLSVCTVCVSSYVSRQLLLEAVFIVSWLHIK